MLLVEITQPSVTHSASKTDDITTRSGRKHYKGGTMLGHGAEAIVFKHPTSHTAVKQSKPFPAKSRKGFIEYIKAIVKHSGGNPSLPQIYSLHFSAGKTKTVATIEMERLRPLADMDEAVIRSLIKSTIRLDDIEKQEVDDPDMTSYELSELFGDALFYAASHDPAQIHNKHMAAAVKIAHAAIQKADDAVLDIAGTNVMVRLTSIGPQLVLTDPVYS